MIQFVSVAPGRSNRRSRFRMDGQLTRNVRLRTKSASESGSVNGIGENIGEAEDRIALELALRESTQPAVFRAPGPDGDDNDMIPLVGEAADDDDDSTGAPGQPVPVMSPFEQTH